MTGNRCSSLLQGSMMLEQVIKFFVVFFVVVEPLSLAPVFASLTEGASDAYKRKMSLKAALVAAGILLLFALTGALSCGSWASASMRSGSSAACCCS
jgi:small neutral amino acid transporter SnatA (MarC family)